LRATSKHALRLDACVVPETMQAPKRVAKYLHSSFRRRRSLAECQHVTAQLLGHRDWHNLEIAVNRSLPSGVLDDELSASDLAVRRSIQAELVLRSLADDSTVYFARSERLYELLSRAVIEETTPTAANFRSPRVLGDCRLVDAKQAVYSELPHLLDAWCQSQDFGHVNWDSVWNKDRQSSLLLAAISWAWFSGGRVKATSVTVEHGWAHLLAQQYALAGIASRPDFDRIYPDDPSERKIVQLNAPLKDEFEILVHEFLNAYPVGGSALKEDFGSVTGCAEVLTKFRQGPRWLADARPPERLPETPEKKDDLATAGTHAYLGVARRYLEVVGAPLDPELREAVARKAVDEMERRQSSPEVQALIDENASWFWEALAIAEPPEKKLSPPGNDRYTHWERVWDDTTQMHARWTAADLERQLNEVTFGSWFWSSSAKDLRRWYKELLPAEAPKRRKYEMLFALKEIDPFPPPLIEDAFIKWAHETATEARRFKSASEMPPRPLHLQHLIGLVCTRLDAFATLTASPNGPQAFATWERGMIAAATSGNLVPVEEIYPSIDAASQNFSIGSYGSPSHVEECIAAAKRELRSAQVILGSPALLKKRMDHWRPDRFVIATPCGCKSRRGAIPKEGALPPTNISCRCREFEWESPVRRKVQEFKEDQFNAKIQRWAMSALVGKATEMPWSSISVRTQSERWDADRSKHSG